VLVIVAGVDATPVSVTVAGVDAARSAEAPGAGSMAPGDVTEARWAAGVLDARLVAWRSAGRLSGRRLVIAAGLAAASGGLAARDRRSFITRADAGAP
jgi:hypothetical protein